jgi:ergothioneine biosynthesis protein EgtB
MGAERGLDALKDVSTANAGLNLGYAAVRRQTLNLCEPLEIEDYGVQPMEDVSPPKWHLAHTTWFFETFILKQRVPAYEPFHETFETLFNSYYNGVGRPFPRAQRGYLSRPTVEQVKAYRSYVDDAMQVLLGDGQDQPLIDQVTLGLHHEQQHQELLLTDLKYNFGHNPLFPVYGGGPEVGAQADDLHFNSFDGGVAEVGATGDFCFDNELPRHTVLLQPFQLANRLVTNGEYLQFMEDGGYRRPDLWLSDGWSKVASAGWSAPLYWREQDGQWMEYRLDGLHELDLNLPVIHVSGFEAAAFAAWSDARLPTEFEWEHAAAACPVQGTFVESQCFHPNAGVGEAGVGEAGEDLYQLYGEAWQWTSSSYAPYPGYRPLPGALGEYNGKFMSSQLVLKGGSCVTPRSHTRVSYRNFFYPPDRWQFSGIRLAQDVE